MCIVQCCACIVPLYTCAVQSKYDVMRLLRCTNRPKCVVREGRCSASRFWVGQEKWVVSNTEWNAHYCFHSWLIQHWVGSLLRCLVWNTRPKESFWSQTCGRRFMMRLGRGTSRGICSVHIATDVPSPTWLTCKVLHGCFFVWLWYT